MIKLVPAPWLKIREDDFGVEVGADRVLVPAPLYQSLKSIGVRSGEEFAAALSDFPSAFVSFTHLTPPQVSAARTRLLTELVACYPEDMREAANTSRVEHGTGALSPDMLDEKILRQD